MGPNGSGSGRCGARWGVGVGGGGRCAAHWRTKPPVALEAGEPAGALKAGWCAQVLAAGVEGVDEAEEVEEGEAGVVVALGGGVGLVEGVDVGEEVEEVERAVGGEVGVAGGGEIELGGAGVDGGVEVALI